MVDRFHGLVKQKRLHGLVKHKSVPLYKKREKNVRGLPIPLRELPLLMQLSGYPMICFIKTTKRYSITSQNFGFPEAK